MHFYRLAERHPWHLKFYRHEVMAVKTGEFRAPKQGEWYLSGAVVEAYKAPKDMRALFHIVQIVRVKKITTFVEIDREVK